jgi:hypothetical protein
VGGREEGKGRETEREKERENENDKAESLLGGMQTGDRRRSPGQLSNS